MQKSEAIVFAALDVPAKLFRIVVVVVLVVAWQLRKQVDAKLH